MQLYSFRRRLAGQLLGFTATRARKLLNQKTSWMELYSIVTVVFDANTAQRDCVIYVYFDINFSIVWRTVSQERLTVFVQALLDRKSVV